MVNNKMSNERELLFVNELEQFVELFELTQLDHSVGFVKNKELDHCQRTQVKQILVKG